MKGTSLLTAQFFNPPNRVLEEEEEQQVGILEEEGEQQAGILEQEEESNTAGPWNYDEIPTDQAKKWFKIYHSDQFTVQDRINLIKEVAANKELYTTEKYKNVLNNITYLYNQNEIPDNINDEILTLENSAFVVKINELIKIEHKTTPVKKSSLVNPPGTPLSEQLKKDTQEREERKRQEEEEARLKEEEEERKRQEEEEKTRLEAEAERKRQEEEKTRLEAEAEAERKRQEEEERAQLEAEAEAERKRQEEEERAQLEAERKRQEEEERARLEAELVEQNRLEAERKRLEEEEEDEIIKANNEQKKRLEKQLKLRSVDEEMSDKQKKLPILDEEEEEEDSSKSSEEEEEDEEGDELVRPSFRSRMNADSGEEEEDSDIEKSPPSSPKTTPTSILDALTLAMSRIPTPPLQPSSLTLDPNIADRKLSTDNIAKHSRSLITDTDAKTTSAANTDTSRRLIPKPAVKTTSAANTDTSRRLIPKPVVKTTSAANTDTSRRPKEYESFGFVSGNKKTEIINTLLLIYEMHLFINLYYYQNSTYQKFIDEYLNN